MSTSEREPMFLRPDEAAALAGLSTRAIYRAIQRGELRAVRLCSRLRISQAAFVEWIECSAVRNEGRRLEMRVAQAPPVRGSFRRLLGDDHAGGTP